MASYATPTQMLERYDARVLGGLCSDTGTAVSSAGLLTDTNLQAHLDDASGLILAACLRGERYTEANLTGLTGNSAKHLVRITCDLAMASLYGRRFDEGWADARTKAEETAEKHLERLRKGEHVFDVDAVKEASHGDAVGPSLAQSYQRQGLRQSVRRFFPHERELHNF